MNIGIELYPHASLEAALKDIGKALRNGYGAGTITNPDKTRDYEDEDYLGFWTLHTDNGWLDVVDKTMLVYTIKGKYSDNQIHMEWEDPVRISG